MGDGLTGAGMNIDALIASPEPFKHAVVCSTGNPSPSRIKFAGLARSPRKTPQAAIPVFCGGKIKVDLLPSLGLRK